MEILATKDKHLNTLTYNDYFKRLYLLATSMFKWEGLPNGIPERFIEDCLFTFGQCAFIEDPTLGFMVTKVAPSGKLNMYNMPIAYTCHALEYHETWDKDDIVIIRNNAIETPTSHTIRLFAKRLTEVERTIDVNIKTQKTPFIITTPEKQRLTLANLLKQYDGNIPFIYGTKELDLEAIKAIKTDSPFIADQLMIYKHDLWNEAMSFLGIQNANTDKRERLISDEVNANDQMVVLSAETMLKERQLACEQIKELFGIDVTVSLRTPHDTIIEVAPAQESNVDNGFDYSYNYVGKERWGGMKVD